MIYLSIAAYQPIIRGSITREWVAGVSPYYWDYFMVCIQWSWWIHSLSCGKCKRYWGFVFLKSFVIFLMSIIYRVVQFHPFSINTISQECLEGIPSHLAQTFIWNQGVKLIMLLVKDQGLCQLKKKVSNHNSGIKRPLTPSMKFCESLLYCIYLSE